MAMIEFKNKQRERVRRPWRGRFAMEGTTFRVFDRFGREREHRHDVWAFEPNKNH